MKSKIELRLEAARIASSLKGVNIKNFCESVAVVEKYLSGCSDLPEVYNEADQIATVMKEMISTLENKECKHPLFPGLKTSSNPFGDNQTGNCLGIGDSKLSEIANEFYRNHPTSDAICEAGSHGIP